MVSVEVFDHILIAVTVLTVFLAVFRAVPGLGISTPIITACGQETCDNLNLSRIYSVPQLAQERALDCHLHKGETVARRIHLQRDDASQTRTLM